MSLEMRWKAQPLAFSFSSKLEAAPDIELSRGLALCLVGPMVHWDIRCPSGQIQDIRDIALASDA